jgi:ADP-ribose pyrophosphatase YjhB (NUDIX family)
VIVRVGDEILLTKNWLGFQKKWRLPGGGVLGGEQPIFAAQRELKEEVGLLLHEQNLIALQEQPFRSKFNYDYYLFTLTLPEKPVLEIDNKEILSAEFMALSELGTMHISEGVCNFLRLAK